ncbi:large ribosomal subunit protein uL22m-like [Styela clava]|uniref:39S ribosomal protein L22, mitochondrial-like n=1 Tax=Styela clava TaxID=7725 RepID=UPI00193AA48C|nr:39S ribosomal protein L22, mitochondrial-like [Styela clava]
MISLKLLFLGATSGNNLRAVGGCFIHTTTLNYGVKNPGQNRIIKEHSEYYSDYWSRDMGEWSDRNKMLYPPSAPGEMIRPAEIHHGRAFIRHSPKKMWYTHKSVQYMNIDEALKNLETLPYKAAKIIAEVLKEAQEEAVTNHNVEFKSNLHIADSFVLPSGSRKIPRYHGKGYMHWNKSRFCHYYVMLREGQAPEYQVKDTAYGMAVQYLNSLRSRTIMDGL